MSNVIKGYSIQNGEPTPDNPVEIESLDIEEDIKILEDWLKELDDFFEKTRINNTKERNALRNVLAERKQDKVRIKELEEENRILEFQNEQVENYVKELKKYNKTVSDRIVEYKKNSIPVQKVKEGLERIEDYFYRLNGPDEDIEYIKNIKKELLEESK